jgi:hypothetical protein
MAVRERPRVASASQLKEFSVSPATTHALLGLAVMVCMTLGPRIIRRLRYRRAEARRAAAVRRLEEVRWRLHRRERGRQFDQAK